MFVTGQGSMLWNSCTLVRNFTLDTLLDFDVGTFYLPPITRESSPFAPEQPQPMSRIGGIGTSIMVSISCARPSTARRSSVRRSS
jgi:hypothetical protein